MSPHNVIMESKLGHFTKVHLLDKVMKNWNQAWFHSK